MNVCLYYSSEDSFQFDEFFVKSSNSQSRESNQQKQKKIDAKARSSQAELVQMNLLYKDLCTKS